MGQGEPAGGVPLASAEVAPRRGRTHQKEDLGGRGKWAPPHGRMSQSKGNSDQSNRRDPGRRRAARGRADGTPGALEGGGRPGAPSVSEEGAQDPS